MLICFLCDAEIEDDGARVGLRGRILCPLCYCDFGTAVEPGPIVEVAVFRLDVDCPACGRGGEEGGFTLDLTEDSDSLIAACPECGHRFGVEADEGPERD